MYYFENSYFVCVFKRELISVWDICFFIFIFILSWTSTVKTGTVPPHEGTVIINICQSCY